MNYAEYIKVKRKDTIVDIRTTLAATSTLSIIEEILKPRAPKSPKAQPKLPKPSDIKKPCYLGITVDLNLDPKIEGVPLYRVVDNSPAAAAGLKPNDIILKINNEPIEEFENLTSYLEKHYAGEQISILIRRGTVEKTINLVLGEKKEDK